MSHVPTETVDRKEDGFELDGEFYRWHVTDAGKDLLLIDRFTGMPVAEFFETVEDEFDRGRAPILLAMIATSVRARHPDWSVDRVYRLVVNTPLGDITFIDADAEAQIVPLPEADEATSDAPSNESSPSSTPPDSSPAEMSSGTQPSSSSPGSLTGSQAQEAHSA